ncbi:MAG TPA: tail fiber domain-containing protein [Xanthobacteraceae bacterium]|nr:tail fiber domain-containing protein [Xanthobacteraceae bacterium]
MSGGATPQQQTQSTSSNNTSNSSSTTGPNSVIGPTLGSIAGGMSAYLNNNPLAPGPAPGPWVAPQSPQTQSAIQTLFGRGASGSPLQATGNNFAASVLNPNYLNVGNDPNFQASLAAAFQPQNQQFANVMVPQLRSQFEGSGRNLGGADGSTVDQALLGLQQSQSNSSAQAVEQAYQARMQNQFNVLNNYIPTSQNMDYQNIGAMQQAGGAVDANAQANIDANIAKYNAQAMAQPNYWTNMAQMLQSIYPGGTTSGNSSSSGNSTGYGMFMPSTNPTASGLGAGMGIAGLALQAAPLLGISDARLKKNIKPIGKTYTGHKLYSYEFLGSSKPEIGVLAQEAEQRDPAAVVTHPSGYKMIDYGRIATGPAGGLL